MGLIYELRRRNVLRVAAGYALVAWIMIEAGSVLLPEFFGAPDWFFKVYVLIVFAGFILALIIAWVFEITPDGVKLESQVNRDTYAPPRRSGWNYALILLLVIALGVSLTFNLTGVRRDDAVVESSPLTAINMSSLAVLPFTNTSADQENQAFADGLHSDLLTRLSRISSLHVISRTSVNEYRDTTKNPRDIARELDVKAIVEGSVQRAGNQVRINIALLNADSDAVLWSDTFTRELSVEDLFAVQTEVSNRIAGALQATLTVEDAMSLASVPTVSLEAFELYAQGIRNVAERRYESLLAAREQFEQAIEIDPNFADAYAGLAKAALLTYINFQAIPEAEAFRIADEATSRALEINDSLAEAYAARGLLLHHRWQRTRVGDEIDLAGDALAAAIALGPSNTDAYVWLASLRENQGRVEEATVLLTNALARDPLSRIPYLNLPRLLALQGRHEDAMTMLVKGARQFPDWSEPYQYLATALQRLGRLDEAVAWDVLGAEKTTDPTYGGNLIGIYLEFGREDLVIDYLEAIPPDHPFRSTAEAIIRFETSGQERGLEDLLALLREPGRPDFLGQYLSRRLVMRGQFETARTILLESVPTLAQDAEKVVDRFNLADAVVYGYILQQLGEDAAAEDVLLQARAVATELPRLGMLGHGIVDVLALVLLGQRDFALDTLRAAVDEGFVSLLVFDSWSLDETPILDSLRDDPRFISIKADIDRTLDEARQNVIDAHESGNWLPLLRPVDPEIDRRI